jgi:hypothetical protein
VGDHEFRLLLPLEQMHDSGATATIARLLRVRVRRTWSERQKLTLLKGRRRLHTAALEVSTL